MRRDTCCKPGRWVDCMEEESKARKNLSRLIHTVQHMPSARYHRDASSLWNLVEKLESFQPPNSSKAPNGSHKTERKSFSRKYLDLRLYPSRDRSSSPESDLKSKNQEKKQQTFHSNKSNKNKKTEMKHNDTDTDKNVEPNANISQDRKPLSKTKYDRKKNCKENVLPENGKNKRRGTTEVQANLELKGSHLKPRPKLQNFELRRKPDGTNISKPNNSTEHFKREKIIICSNKENDKSFSYKVLDHLKDLKNSRFIKDKSNSLNQFSLNLDKAFIEGTPLENDQASMVKKLTSYWNNLLNNEVDDNEASSVQEGSDVPLINKSLQDLARSIHHNRQQITSLSRHRSESSVSIRKKLEGFNDSSGVSKIQKENKDQFFECLNGILSNGDVSNGNPKMCLNLIEEPSHGKNVVLLEMYDRSCGDNPNIQVNHKSTNQVRAKPNFDLNAQHAIDVMEKLVRKLKQFRELPLISDDITLSHSLRTMICLMTATVLSSTEREFDEDLEPVVVEVTGQEDIASNVNSRISSGYAGLSEVSATDKLNYKETRNTNGSNDNLQLVALQGITMRKVEEALRYLTLCKDYLWTEFLLSPRFIEGAGYNSRYSPRSFTFVIEEEIVFEDDGDEDGYPTEDETEYEEGESTMGEVCQSLFGSILVGMDRLSELAADMILHHRPDSFEGLVRTVYQTMVSILVWWVITKDVFCK